MFTLTGYTPTNYSDTGGAILSVIGVDTTASGAILSPLGAEPTPLTVTTTAETTIDGLDAVITVPSSHTVTTIATPGGVYTRAVDPTNPKQGEFVQSSTTVRIRFGSRAHPSTVSYQALTWQYPAQTVPSDDVPQPHPSLYSQWNLTGEIQYSRSFEGHPTATFQFATQRANRDVVLNTFRNRTPITLYGMGFEINSCEIVEPSPEHYQDGFIFFKLQLTGRHAYPASQPFRLLKAIGGRKVGDYYSPLSQLATGAGLNYQGVDLKFRVPRDTDVNATEQFESVVNGLVRIGQAFTFWSNANTIETRVFGKTKVHYLADADILSEELSYSYPGKEMIYQGVQLVEVYKNTELQLSQPDRNDRDYPPRRVIVEPKEDPSIPPEDVTDLRSVGLTFDNGGPTKTQTRKVLIGNTEIEETGVTYGFAFRLSDVYEYVTVIKPGGSYQTYSFPSKAVKEHVYNEAINPADFWIPIKAWSKIYRFNGYGYLVEEIETGTQTMRLKQESQRETLDLNTQRQQALATAASGGSGAVVDKALYTAEKLLQQIDAYFFGYVVPTNKTVTYELASLGTYFKDLSTPSSDPDYVPPFFCIRENCSEVFRTLQPDPEDSQTKPRPPIVAGKAFYQSKSRTITCVTKGYESFNETISTCNAEGCGLRQTSRTTETHINLGRPQTHEQSPVYSAIVSAPTDPTKKTGFDPSNYKILLNVEGSNYPATDPERDSKSYPTSDPEIARLAAETDLSISNSKSAESLRIAARYNRNYQEGDLIWVRGFLYVIFGVSWTESIKSGGSVVCEGGIELELGRYLRPKVTMKLIPQAGAVISGATAVG